MQLGLSTVLARGSRPGAARFAPDALIDFLLRAEAAFVELDATLSPAYLRELMPRLHARGEALPVGSVENVCPSSRAAAAELGARDRDEAEAAVGAARQTLAVAGELGARLVLVRLGEVRAARARWPAVRRAFLRGELEEDPTLAEDLLAERAAYAPRHLDAARRSLEVLARACEPHGLRLGILNPARGSGLPSPVELGLLLADLAGAPLGPAFDAPAAHLADVMGLVPLAATLDAWKDAEHLRLADACGPLAGLAPGRGELGGAGLAAMLGAFAQPARAVFAPWPGLDEGEVREGMAALAKLCAAPQKKATGS